MPLRNPIAGFIVLMMCTEFSADPGKPDSIEKELRRFQGTWKIKTLESDGNRAPVEFVESLRLVFKGDSMTFVPGEPGFTNFENRIDPNLKPATIDMTHADGTNQGKTRKGIYPLEGDRLRFCFGNTDERPDDFSMKPDSGRAMYTL